MSELSVNLTKSINAPIEQVFDAWLDPKILSNFMQPMPGMPAPEIKINASEGGRFVIKMHVEDQEIPHEGTYHEIQRPNKLVFSWESPFSGEGSVVTLNFKPLDNNNTELNLVHVKFPNEESRSNHEGGWTTILELLNTVMHQARSPA